MYLFDMTNGIPHVASSIQFTSEKTRDPDQLEVGRMTTGSDGSTTIGVPLARCILLVPYESHTPVITGVCTDRLAGFKLLKPIF